MAEYRVGDADGIPEGGVVIVEVDGGLEVGVLRVLGQLRAFENRCPHQGGPVCYGRLVGRQEAVLDEGRRVVAERLSTERFDLVCPWHGWSYDALSGECIGDRHYRLRPWQVATRDGSIFLSDGAAG